ncbi:MAG: type II toxin-antitoxin system Phd/YefM family antitoxin [Gammaproteobacteria bacterium]|nr:type II toxin-antitoxin system Phd/YefM family antitoxin [Gammaproteobacteria bacterium]NBT44146.1 type II toxin-antitoxin system Phd/YefM family antitoxin [Gammaproteobacteria bacterium]NBY23086.1 type II toxin-antitoxin system Phd/YefM family antitoxin [Gammaproteobacteria bacterium]NDE35535.1 type II toxin-antitoxin system Phd/YefM family antitoxin [Gammaproteobacteria bacterium]NDG88752.1 type II toxin-antitoxin system Phd/YefM family antitoxin [Gammaproteobacteria bacterium]
MSHISANDLKTRGIAAIEASLADHPEAIVSVRGKDRFVVMDIEQYQYLRECELAAALAETRADLAARRYVEESAEEHLKRIGS